MTNEEAIKILRSGLFAHADVKINHALNFAIEALEKQIPNAKHKYSGYRCVCGAEVAKHQLYCEYCGQALLDWSDTK